MDVTSAAGPNLAAEKRREDEERRLLVFALSGESYAIPLSRVREVIALTEITSVPYTPSHFKGIMNLRGQVISVIDLRLKFRMSKAEITSETAIIILDLAPLSLGVIVDEVNSVLAAEADAINQPPEIESSVRSDYITGIFRKDEKLILLLDIANALDAVDLKAAKSAVARQPTAA